MASVRRPRSLALPVSLAHALVYVALFLAAFLPRLLALDAYVAPDEGKWIFRSAHFLQALLAGDLAQMTSAAATPEVEVLAPAVPTMWTGALGLLAKYWFDDAPRPAALPDYLQTIPEKTEKIPLDFYPWTRLPTVLLASLAIPVFYYLLAKLWGSGPALLAALLLAFDPFFIGLSRVIHHDALVSIFIVFSLLTLLLYKQKAKAKAKRERPIAWLIVSAVAGGLALLTKPTALYLVIFVALFLILENGLPRSLSAWRWIVGEGLAWVIIVVITFVLLWPALWTAPLATLTGLLDRSASAVSEDNNYSLLPAFNFPLPELGFLFYPVNWLFKTTPAVLIGLIALLVATRRSWFKSQPIDESTSQRVNEIIIHNSQFRAKGPLWAIHNLTGWTAKWLALFALLFLLLLLPADTRDIRYFLPAMLILQTLAALGLFTLTSKLHTLAQSLPLGRPTPYAPRSPSSIFYLLSSIFYLLLLQLPLTLLYAPYFVDYLNPLAGGPWLGPRLVKIGSGEGLDQMGRYLDQKPQVKKLTVATSFWESFVPFYTGRYTKPHYDEEADYILIYLRQIQNNNPFPEYWTYFSARSPEYKVSLTGLDYAWLYPGPQVRLAREADFGNGLRVRGYRLDRPAAQPGQPANLTLVWAGAASAPASQPVTVRLLDSSGRLWAETSGSLLDPAGPSVVEGHYQLKLPADIPRDDYALQVSLGEVSRQVGLVPVRLLDQPLAPLVLEANFGDLMLLGGADVKKMAADTLEISLTWQEQQPISQSYTTFVHAVDETGAKWGQVDRMPHLGERELPTNLWQSGEWVVDKFQLVLKPDTPAGTYTLLAGVYNAQTGERLPLLSETNPENVVKLTSVTLP